MKHLIKEFIKNVLYALVGFSLPNQRVNVYKTMMVNFRLFGINGLRKSCGYIPKHKDLFPWENNFLDAPSVWSTHYWKT